MDAVFAFPTSSSPLKNSSIYAAARVLEPGAKMARRFVSLTSVAMRRPQKRAWGFRRLCLPKTPSGVVEAAADAGAARQRTTDPATVQPNRRKDSRRLTDSLAPPTDPL